MSNINNLTYLNKIRPVRWQDGDTAKYLKDLENWVRQVTEALRGVSDTQVYTVATLPPAADFDPDENGFASFVYVSDESGGAQMAFSDGTNWRRFTDRAIVS